MVTLDYQKMNVLPGDGYPGQSKEEDPDPLACDAIITHLEEYGQPVISSFYYFIRARGGGYSLYRITVAGGLYSCEKVDHEQYGISDDDLGFAAETPGEAFPFEGYFPVSGLIISKLEAILE